LSNITSQGRPSLFRGEAFAYHFREQESRGVLNTSLRHPWSIVLASIVLAAMAVTYTLVTQVEVVYRVEGAMNATPVHGAHRGERLAIAYVHGKPDLEVNPGARVRLELLEPLGSRSHYIDGRLSALAREPLRLEIVLDQPVADPVVAEGRAPIPIRIHAVGCRQSLWRLALSATSGCLKR
jgi:hypothetical protein